MAEKMTLGQKLTVAKAIHDGLLRNGTVVMYSGTFQRIIADAIDAHVAQPAQTEGWKPIATAPKDARILLCREGDECSHAGFWQEAVEDGVDYMGEDAGFVDVDFQVFFPSRTFGQLASQYEGRQPTLWMPLPPPPTDRRAPEVE